MASVSWPALLLLVPAVAVAQQRSDARFVPATPLMAAPAAPAAASLSSQAQQLPCPDCEPRPKNFARASAELVTVLVVPWAYNYYVRDKDFAHVGFKSWWENITGDWVWDDNTFQTNQAAHPLHGAFYFNSFRSNGYNFWASSGAAITGAYLWECCGETHPPAPNDLINTSLGGIALGEMMWRLSTLALDNTATGSERTWREIGGFLASPWHGFNRLVEGRSNDIAANPADWRPAWIQGALDLGYRALGSTGSSTDVLDSALTSPFLNFVLVYGRPVEDLTGKPFSTFTVNAEMELGSERQWIQKVTAIGNLGGRVLRNDDGVKHTLAARMNYEYYFYPNQDTALNAVLYNYGAQSFLGGLHSQFRLSPRWYLLTQAAVRGVALAGVRSDYYKVTGEGRNYDFGPGVGIALQATVMKPGRWVFNGGYNGTYIHTLSGTDYDHYLDQGWLDARWYFNRRFGLGARFDNFHRSSRPTDAATAPGPATSFTSPQLRFYMSAAVPRWGEAGAEIRQ